MHISSKDCRLLLTAPASPAPGRRPAALGGLTTSPTSERLAEMGGLYPFDTDPTRPSTSERHGLMP